MRVKVYDTTSDVSVWTSDLDPDEFTEGAFSCDCLRHTLFKPSSAQCCAEGGDCRGRERYIVTKVVDSDEEDLPSLHECNSSYLTESLLQVGVPLD